MKSSFNSIIKLLFFGTPIQSTRTYSCSATTFIRSREVCMTTNEYFFRHPDSAIKFLGEFNGDKLGQFNVSAYSSHKLDTLGLHVLSSFSGWIEEQSENQITLFTAQRLTRIGRVGFTLVFLMHFAVLLAAFSQLEFSDSSSFIFLGAILLMFSIFFTFFFRTIHKHRRFFEDWFIRN